MLNKTNISNTLFSTTKLLVKEKPILDQNSEYKLVSKLFLPINIKRKEEGGLRKQGFFKKSYKNKPLISIVTIVYNGEKHLEQTIKSVLEQTYDNVEYIIIDGGSTDCTIDIIQKYEGCIDYWVSEPDGGISDAFNKGIELTTGEVIGLLNADDWYEVDCIVTIVNNLGNGAILHAKINYWTDDQIEFTSAPNHDHLEEDMNVSHPTVFIKRGVYKKIGLFKTSYKLAMDYEILLRAYRQNIRFYYINHVLSNMRNGGTSAEHWVKATWEVEKAKVSLGISRVDAYIHFFTHALWPYVKVLVFNLMQKYNMNYIIKFHSFIKRNIQSILGLK
jgi:glycosyltransferase involved in cell wall biosynthesis